MKINRELFKKIALNKPFITIAIVVLLVVANYMMFTVVRTYISAQDGMKEFERVASSDAFILNLDPKANMSSEKLNEDSLDEVYTFLMSKWKIGLTTSGFVSDLQNKKNIDVPYEYLNEEALNMRPFEVSSGEDLTFDYDIVKGTVPVLVGWGLRDEYPVGKTFQVRDPLIQKDLKYRVVGVLKKNESRSNNYVLDSRRYTNYTVVVPVNLDFIAQSDYTFKINSLMDLMILDASKEEIETIKKFILDKTGLNFNSYNQDQNNKEYIDLSKSTLRIVVGVTVAIVLIVFLLLMCSVMSGLALAIKDITIHLLVGLRQSTLRSFFYLYYGSLVLFSLGSVVLFNVASHFVGWATKNSLTVTFGVLASPASDWLSIGFVLLPGIVFTVIMAEISMLQVRRLPISVGVLK